MQAAHADDHALRSAQSGKSAASISRSERLGRKVAQSEPRLDGLETVAQPPSTALRGAGRAAPARSRSPAPRGPNASSAPNRAPLGTPDSHGARDGPGRTAQGRARGRCRARAAPGNRAGGRPAQGGRGGDPLALHPFELFEPSLGARRSRCLQRRNQCGGVETPVRGRHPSRRAGQAPRGPCRRHVHSVHRATR